MRDSLSAKKAWFFIDDVVVCLGADISSGKSDLVSTTLNQTFLKGDVYYFDGSVKKMNPESEISSNDYKWVYHNKIAYYPLQRTQLTVSDKTQDGDWNDIAKVYPSKKQSAKIFSIESEQGKRPQHGSYSYVILPAVSLDYIKRYKPTFTVIQNNAEAQILTSENKKTDMFVIYKPVRLSIAGLGEVIFENPGLYMLKKQPANWIMTAADPTHKLDTLKFTLNGKKYQMNLPQNGDLGKSITKKLD